MFIKISFHAGKAATVYGSKTQFVLTVFIILRTAQKASARLDSSHNATVILTDDLQKNAMQVSKLALHFERLSLHRGRRGLAKKGRSGGLCGRKLAKMKEFRNLPCKNDGGRWAQSAIYCKTGFKMQEKSDFWEKKTEEKVGKAAFFERKICKK